MYVIYDEQAYRMINVKDKLAAAKKIITVTGLVSYAGEYWRFAFLFTRIPKNKTVMKI